MRKLRFYILAIASVCAVACADNAKKSDNAEYPTPIFSTFEYERIDEGNYSFTISYERITNTADSQALAIIDSMNYSLTFGEFATEDVDLQRSAEMLVDEAYSNMMAFNTLNLECEMHIYQVADVVRNNSVVRYDTVIDTDFGGIYPMVTHNYECYDLASGNAYDFSYLNDGEWYEALTALLFEKLDKEYGSQFHITSPEYLHLPQVAYLTDEGLVFEYQTYEIGDAELGSISVEVTDAELEAVGAPLLWE